MKYILALFVLLAVYIPENIADPSKEIESVHKEMDHGVCVFKSRGKWEVPNNCGTGVGISSYKTLSKGIQSSWKLYGKQMEKKAKYFTKQGVKRITMLQPNRKDIRSMAKMSTVEFNKLANNLAIAKNDTIKVSMHILELFNATLSLLDSAFVEASSQICARIYVDEIETLSERSHNELYCLAERNETDKFQDLAKESERELVNLARSSGVKLWDAYKVQAKHIKDIASRGGEILSETRNHFEEIKAMGKTNEKLMWFINGSVKKLDEFAHITKDKCNQVASENVGKLEHLINSTVISIETLVRAEIKLNNDLAFVTEAGYSKAIEEKEKEIQGIYKTFEENNMKNNANFISEVHATIADAIETCKKTISVKLKHKL